MEQSLTVKKLIRFGWQCLRCGHEWIPQHPGYAAAVCPKCKSAYWNRPRKAKRAKRSHDRK